MRRFKIILKSVAAVAAIIVLLDGVLLVTFAHWRPNIGSANGIIVLGAAINTPALYHRTLTGLDLYEQGKAKVMVLSGGKIAESDISEAQYMEKVIKANADAPVNYVIEDQSGNTYENIRNSKAKLGDASSVVIVSDEFHLARAVLLAKRAGFKQVYWDAPKPTYYNPSQLRFYYFREFVAMISYIPKFITG